VSPVEIAAANWSNIVWRCISATHFGYFIQDQISVSTCCVVAVLDLLVTFVILSTFSPEPNRNVGYLEQRAPEGSLDECSAAQG
jgi:hypothetical protein